MKPTYLNQLIAYLLTCKNKTQMEAKLAGLFTKNELEEISKRLELVRLLKAGWTQRAVAKELGVGIATVIRGANELKKGRFKDL